MPASLFDTARHEPLNRAPWRDADARSAIERITNAAIAAFDTQHGWPRHPLDEADRPDERFHNLYFGSGGVIWALDHLAREGAIDAHGVDTDSAFVDGIVDRNRAGIEGSQHGTASYLFGDAGLLLLQLRRRPDAAGVDDRLFDVVKGNLRNPAREALWGSPGTVLAAIFRAEATGRERWRDLVREAVQIIHDEMQPQGDHWIWQQDLYGRQVHYLGAGHGFAGNVYPAVRAAGLLDAALVESFVDRAWATLDASAVREGGEMNWFPSVERRSGDTRPPLMQDCHGSPGIVCRLAGAPRTDAWDALLLAAGGAVWRAGPLTKGASMCHGTAGSALACLKLARRTGEARWLDRARALAMHSVGQVERHRAQFGCARHSLWTGDLGLACVLWECIMARDRFPTLDVF